MKISVRRVNRHDKATDAISKPPGKEFNKSKDKTGREAFWEDFKMEYDPKTGKPKYKGQKPDSGSSVKRTVPAEELAKRREPEKKGEKPRPAEQPGKNPILDIWNAKIDTEKGETSAPEDKKESKPSEEQFEVKVGGSCSDLPTLSAEELERVLKHGLRGTEIKWDGTGNEEELRKKIKIVEESIATDEKEGIRVGAIQAYKEHVAKELGKDVADVTHEDIEKSLLAYWDFNSKPKEPEQKAKPKTTEEKFDDFMNEKPK